MFTGIIQGTGRLASLVRSGKECRLGIVPDFPLENIIDGESIAVNGTCLSVEEHSGSNFSVYASAETMGRTSLHQLSRGALVNLERALAVGDRLGGHIVSGHVDCLATVQSIETAGSSLRCRFSFPAAHSCEVVKKGSVTLDGISLTVNDCGNGFLEVNIIPDTQKRTTMRLWKPGVSVNMETDIIGKYVRRLLEAQDPAHAQSDQPKTSGITRELLLKNGFC